MKIMIVDDHPAFRHGLRQLISAEPRFEVVAEANDGSEGLDLANKSKAEVVILDINLGEKTSGLDLLEPLKKSCPNVPIILFSGIGLDEKTLQEARQKGAVGYLNKTQPLDQMWAEVQRALRG